MLYARKKKYSFCGIAVQKKRKSIPADRQISVNTLCGKQVYISVQLLLQIVIHQYLMWETTVVNIYVQLVMQIVIHQYLMWETS